MACLVLFMGYKFEGKKLGAPKTYLQLPSNGHSRNPFFFGPGECSMFIFTSKSNGTIYGRPKLKKFARHHINVVKNIIVNGFKHCHILEYYLKI